MNSNNILQLDITDNETLENLLSERGLKVIEIYSQWCGPCKSVIPTFKKLRLEKDDVSTLKFLSVCCEKCDFLEKAKERIGNSEPFFLLYRNGILKYIVEGADTPKLITCINELVPISIDADNLDENPIYISKKEKSK